jgi:hypothetical protein
MYRAENSDNLAEKSILIIHRPKNEQLYLSSGTTPLSIIETRRYGNSAVDFIRPEACCSDLPGKAPENFS